MQQEALRQRGAKNLPCPLPKVSLFVKNRYCFRRSGMTDPIDTDCIAISRVPFGRLVDGGDVLDLPVIELATVTHNYGFVSGMLISLSIVKPLH